MSGNMHFGLSSTKGDFSANASALEREAYVATLEGENEALQNRIFELTYTDLSTGLKNYNWFLKVMPKSVQSAIAAGESLTVVVGDIDHFKEINTKHGHLMGDEVLKGVAAYLSHHIRGTDFIGRRTTTSSADEFYVILPHSTGEDARRRMRELNANLPQYLKENNLPATTLTFGIATYHPQPEEKDVAGVTRTLEALADMTLMHGKEVARGQTYVTDVHGVADLVRQ